MFEHTGSRYFPFNVLLHLMNPIAKLGGPEITRDTVGNVRRAGFEIEALYADVAAAAERNHCQRTLAREAFIRRVRTRILDFDVGNDRGLRVVKGIDFDTKRTAYVRITAVGADQQSCDHAQCAIPARDIHRDAIGMDIETVELG